MMLSIGNALKRLFLLSLPLCLLAGAPLAQAVSPRQLVEVADFGDPVVSPDGGSVAFRLKQASIERNVHDTVWYVQRMDGASPPRRVADGGLPLRNSAGMAVPAPALWSRDGRWIYYRALADGRIEVWRAAADGSGAEPMTRDAADVRAFSLSADGRRLEYSVGATREAVVAAEQDEYDRGIHIDDNTPLSQNLFRSGYIEGRLATQRLDFWFDRVTLLAQVPDRWKAVDLADRTVRDLPASAVPPATLAPADLAGRIDEPWKLAHDPRSGRIALLTRVGDQSGLRHKPDVELAILAGKDARHPVKCRDALCTGKAITDVLWRPGSDEVLFTVTDVDEGQAQSIFRWNVETGMVHPVVHARGLVSGEGRWTPRPCGVSSSALVCIAAEADRPPRLERIDLETGERRVLFEPNAALAREMADTTEVRLLRWTDAAGRRFTGQFYPARRTGDAPPPLFVTYYRCLGFLRGGAGDEWPLASLAAHGVAALCINAITSPADAVERYDTGRSALQGAIELLAAQGEIDRTKVGMGGLSFGSEVTLWTLIHSDLLAAASVTSPAASQQYYLLGGNKGEAFFAGMRRNWQLGSFEETPDRWRQLAPSFNLDKVRAPLLVQAPEQEFSHMLDYVIPLRRSGLADAYVFPHEPHNKFQPRHRLAAYQRNLDWFRFWLLGVEDADPGKAAQYARWRSMRARLPATAVSDGGV